MKKRTVYQCNLKLLLIFCVVLGHALERDIGASHAAHMLYRAIYLFHMPLFVFLSGLGVKDSAICFKRARATLRTYLLAQGVVVLFYWITQPEAAVRYIMRPYWHLWYLLSLCGWFALAGLLLLALRRVPADKIKRCQAAVFAGAVALGLVCGCVPAIGRAFSLSRTIVFWPFFLAGMFWGRGVLAFVARRRRLLACLLPAAARLFWLCLKLPVAFFYQAEGYAALELSALTGCLSRLLTYGASAVFSVLVLALCPRRKLAVTAIGCDTLMIYLLHPLLINLLPFVHYPSRYAVPADLLFALIITAALALVFRPKRGTYVLEP